jgi:hypothetical protein
MRLTIAPIGIEVGTFDLQIRAPGTVRYIAFQNKKQLVMTAGQPDFVEQPVMFVESSPEGPLVNRRFMAITHGQHVETDDESKAVWAGTGVSARGFVLHLFEIRKNDR